MDECKPLALGGAAAVTTARTDNLRNGMTSARSERRESPGRSAPSRSGTPRRPGTAPVNPRPGTADPAAATVSTQYMSRGTPAFGGSAVQRPEIANAKKGTPFLRAPGTASPPPARRGDNDGDAPAGAKRQGLTLVHFSAQPDPFLTQSTP